MPRVPAPVTNLYAKWREQLGLAATLQEDRQAPPERLLQAVWYHQRLRREQLATVDGRRLQVLHPGFWNHEAGPDFRQAVVQFGDDEPRSGDVEVDLHPGNWQSHRHHQNPAYRTVVLHVVWEGAGQSPLPTLVMKPVLDAPIGELHYWFASESPPAFPSELAGQCCDPLRPLTDDQVRALLEQAAMVRLHAKAAQIQARARQTGWEQALWEGLFRALGYKHNVWPMQRLAELRARIATPEAHGAPTLLQARLLGVSGLLPSDMPRAGTQSYLRTLWDFWWRDRDALSDCTFPREVWRLHGSRPANHPQRRLALAAHWLSVGNIPARVEAWGRNKQTTISSLVSDLAERLQAPADEFWSHHWTLRSKPLPDPQPLLGATRVTDLAINVILPWLWIRAVEGKNDPFRHEVERRFLQWPAAEDNAPLRLARQRLLGTTARTHFRTAAAQQGWLQITRDFCEHSNAVCANCRFPDLVREFVSCAGKT